MKNASIKIPQKFDLNKLPEGNRVELPKDYFLFRTFGEVITDGSLKPPRKKIAGVFLYEDTNTLLFSRTNYGKSLASFQVGFHAATGTSLSDRDSLRNECDPKRVLIVDMELEDRDIFERHGKAFKGEHATLLNQNLAYIHENPNSKPIFQFELLEKIEIAAEKHKAELVIIDNITKISPDLLKADEVSKVIEILKRIRQKIGASFLIIAHTTKGDPRTAINSTSYYGSAMIQNFFTEISYLDATKIENQFMWVHAKTKRKECFVKSVPVFERGEHPQVGIGFNFLYFDEKDNISLPESASRKRGRKTPLTNFSHIIKKLAMDHTHEEIAGLCDVTRQHITKILKVEGDEESI